MENKIDEILDKFIDAYEIGLKDYGDIKKEIIQTILAEFERMLPKEKDDYGVIPKEISYNQAIQDIKARLKEE